MPTSAVLYPQSVMDGVPNGLARKFIGAGPYGAGFAPFVPGKNGQLQKDMELNLSRERFFEDRRTLLSGLDKLKRDADTSGQFEALDEIQQQAYEILLGGGVSRALDLSLEDSAVLEKYDTSEYVTKDAWDRVKRGRAGYYSANAGSIGKLMCLARRLCEAGCGL